VRDDERQRLNVRTIRLTLASALHHIPPDQAALCVARARQLLTHARNEASAPSVISDIEAVEAELDSADGTARQREG
jgi:hypothetical protein